MEILHIEHLNFTYPGVETPTLRDLSFSVEEGEFIVICGASGCGKTTLLRLLKRELAPHGTLSGEILFAGTPLQQLDDRTAAREVGFVLQNPEHQIATDKVWHELSFGLENLGLPTEVIRRRVAEMASFFGIQEWFRKDTASLSGGQKQMLNLASVMAAQPSVLLLDEPTSQLDPIAAADFIATLRKLNRELGLTILLVEHRLEEVFPIADRVMVMDQGQITLFSPPDKIGRGLAHLPAEHPLLAGLPSAVRIFQALGREDDCPLTVRDGRQFLKQNYSNRIDSLEIPPYRHSEKVALEVREAWFRYRKELPDVVRGASLKVYEGEIFCILGGNGTGKTTLLNLIAGLSKPYRGNIFIRGKKSTDYGGNSLYRKNLALLPQDPQTLFIQETLREDLEELCRLAKFPRSEWEARILRVTQLLGISHKLSSHPYDLSGGEQQKAAIAKMLLLEPKILLMDEPTKGIDAGAKTALAQILQALKKEGITLLIVTHDVEFAAEYADRCALFFDGELLSSDPPSLFFTGNNFYTTAANRISRGIYQNAVTCGDVVRLCRENGVKEAQNEG
ncbi:MAG: energy-coupling factor ABC transporter ATP-binding protein [Oscillospiraceae bacterium]|nr:energy-coupling factor ABC transporter ATP-binding protein [Oscillospiraceae bacterium]